MYLKKRASFSPNNLFFASFNSDDKLLVWDISSNTNFTDFKFDSNLHGICTSLHWIPMHRECNFPKRPKTSTINVHKEYLLALGTVKGDLLLYNTVTKNLHSHLPACHSDAVNDIDFDDETNSGFTCSNDKSIAVWDILSGKVKSKWTADDNPIFSICVLDGNNLLSSSSSILWWNVSEKLIVKKFEGHSTEVFKLLPVNASLLKSCYFLSAANNDHKVKAWSLNSKNTQTPVASFILSDQPEDMDVSRSSSKDKPLILSVVTEKGFCHFYEHTLNGNLDKPLHPKATVEIIPKNGNTESNTKCYISTKLSEDSELCIVACQDRDKMTFKTINVKELFKDKCENAALNISPENCPLVVDTCKIGKNHPLNGFKTPKTSENSPRKKESVFTNSPQNTSCNRLFQYSSQSSSISSETVPENEKCNSNRNCIKDTDISSSHQSISMFLKGLQTRNDNLIDIFLRESDSDSISNYVKYLPVHTIKVVLEEIVKRLRHNQRYSNTIGKWLKEILRLHLDYLIESKDTAEILCTIRELIHARKTTETISKMTILKGLLSFHHTQNISSDESDSDTEEIMDL